MFHPTVIAATLDGFYRDPELAPQLASLPDRLHDDYPVEWCHQMREAIDGIKDEDTGALTRTLTEEEAQFIVHEIFRCKADYSYAAQRYHFISAEGVGLKPLYPLWESQAIALETIGRVEHLRHQDRWGAVLLAFLKARQLGLSTLTQSILAHKVTTQGHLRGMVASDVEDSSKHLYGMFETILDNLPWWLKPAVKYKAIGERRVFDTGTVYWAAWGKSSRGGLKEKGGQKGNLGRGKTVSQFHISEYSTWEYPQQLRDGFFPAVPLKISTFGVVESTAKGRNDEWHRLCLGAMSHDSDFTLCFIPWYAEISKYARPAPPAWVPDDTTLAHAKRCEQEGPKYLFRPVTLTREQLYWWEVKRKSFEASGALYQFLEEYPAEPNEAFQYSGRSPFPIHVIERIRNAARPPIAVCELRPQTPAARLVDDARQKIRAEETGKAFTPLAELDVPDKKPFVPIILPDGYGFRAIGTRELHDRTRNLGDKALLDLLQVWEAPRTRGPRRYIMSVDVSDGVGLDRSVVDILRIATLFEPAEQVAQFITDSRDAASVAYCCDALGRWYTDEDGVEAKAAIEVNIGPGGVTQNMLQLHLGYTNFFIWEYVDAADPGRRRTTRIGWVTNTRTRPILLGKLYSALTALDPVTNQPDLIVHSEWTLTDLQDFQSETGRLEDGEAAPGKFDDCVMGLGIGSQVAWLEAGGERVPIDERRRVRTAEAELHKAREDQQARDWRNSAVPADYSSKYVRPEDDPGDCDVTTRLEGDAHERDPFLDNGQWFGYSH